MNTNDQAWHNLIRDIETIGMNTGDTASQYTFGFMQGLLESMTSAGLIPKTVAAPILSNLDIKRRAITVECEDVIEESSEADEEA